jgi:two-component system NtrC family response regulator
MKGRQDHARPTLLLVEDDAEIREQLKWALASEYTVLEAADRPTAVMLLQSEHPLLVTLDLGLPPNPDDATEGLAALEEFLAADRLTKVIVMTGNSDRANALKAIDLGAYDYLVKPVQLEVLKVVLQRASYLARLERENRGLQEQVTAAASGDIIGVSAPMQRTFDMIRRVAASEVPVLITGESGVGKELVARSIHLQSSRRAGPFVAINCGAIPETLLESELFGHEKGSFTGAHVQRKGRIESAQGGTLFFDEIGELSLGLQVKLLRFLQEQRIERIGGREEITVDARVIAATNRDLAKAMSEGRFREDLYYRLNVVAIVVPPLRDRAEDIPLLAKAMLHRYAGDSKRKITGFSRQAMMALQAHGWPGNVRELENRMKRALIMAQGPRLTPEDLELSPAIASGERSSLKEARREVEKEIIRRTLAKHEGNITRTAAELGISRPTLHDLISKYSIER